MAAAGAQDFPYALRWKRLVGTPPPALVVEAGDAVLFAQADGTVVARRRQDGLRLWWRRPGGPVGPGLAVAGDRLLVADRWGGVRALSPNSGDELWAFQRTGRGQAYLRVVGDALLVADGDGVLYCLDLARGDERWRLRTARRPHAAPAVAGGRVFALTAEGELLALDLARGRRLDRVSVDRTMRQVYASGRAVWVVGAQAVARFDLDLRPAWHRWLGTALVGPPLRVGERLLGAGANGFLYGLDPRSGDTAWKQLLDGPVVGGMTATAEGAVLVTESGVLASFTAAGQQRWQRRLPAPRDTRVWATAGGRLYLATDGHLLAFDLAPVSVDGDTLWWETLDRGVKSGYGWQRWRAAGGLLTLDSYAVSWRSGFVQLHRHLELDAATLAPRRIERRRVEATQVLTTVLVHEGDTLRVERRLLAGRESWAVPLPAGATVAAALPRWLQRRRLPPGQADSVLIVDPEHGGVRSLRVRATGLDTARGRVRYRLRYGPLRHLPGPGGWDLPPDLLPAVELVLWVDGEGAEARTEVPAFGSVERRVESARARDWIPAPAPPGVRLDHPVDAPDRLDSLVVRLPAGLGDASALFPLDGRQTLRRDSAGTILVVGRQSLPPVMLSLPELARRRSVLEPYLAPSLLVQSEAPRIQALARRIVPAGDVDAWQAVAAIHRWVYDHMVPVDTNVRFKSSLEVLDDLRGTCSEYAVLFAALARAAGIPTRFTVGWAVAADGRLVLHIWPQVYVGNWVETDPSWNALTVPASHIKTGQGLLHPAHLERLNLPLEWIRAHADSLHLLAYGGAGRPPFLAAAESLWAVADAADRHFETAAAQAARYELAALPWNRRSGTALIAIARHHLETEEWSEAAWALDRIDRLDPGGPQAGAVLYYRARIEARRGHVDAARHQLESLVSTHPEDDYADDALALLAELVKDHEGCGRAAPYYERLVEVYAESGWASVAASALHRCQERRALLREGG